MKNYILSTLALLSALFVVSCGKKETPETEIPQLSVEVKDAAAVYEVAQHQTLSIEVLVTANPVSGEAYTITLGANSSLVSSYNAKHGTSYSMLPAEAYSLETITTMLPRYSQKSTTCKVNLKGEGCDPNVLYLLPVSIETVQGGTNFRAPEDKSAFIVFKMIPSAVEGSGTESDPFIMKSTESLMAMHSMLRDNTTIYFKLTKDVDFSGVTFSEDNPWIPAEATEGRKAVFDGDNHTIKNFKADAGLFSILEGSVKNLTIDGAEIDCGSKNKGGIIAGTAGTEDTATNTLLYNITVKNSSVASDYERTGAVIGYVKGGVVENVTVTGCTVTGFRQVGGVIGRMDLGQMINCTSSGEINATGYYVGGIVGYVDNASIKNSSAEVKVTCSLSEGNYSRTGGLIGQIHGGLIEKCHASGDVDSDGHFVGGLAGVASAEKADISIVKSYATGNVTYTPESGNKAGYAALLGRMETGNVTIEDCYATGKVKAYRWSGGFVGDVNTGNLIIKNGYTSSDISKIGPDTNGNYECGVVVGNVRDASKTTITATGFVAWNVSGAAFCFPADALSTEGNYFGTEGSVSKQAATLKWSESVWNLSTDFPTLK